MKQGAHFNKPTVQNQITQQANRKRVLYKRGENLSNNNWMVFFVFTFK